MTVRALTLELRDRGVVVDHVSVCRLLKGSVFSFKKTLLASEQDRPAVARWREQWRKYQDRVDPRRLVFIDETWAKTNMAPLRGWGTHHLGLGLGLQSRTFPARKFQFCITDLPGIRGNVKRRDARTAVEVPIYPEGRASARAVARAEKEEAEPR